MKNYNISAGILAGGKSSRMGRNKAFLPWNDSTMLENLTDLFSDFPQLMISVGNRDDYADLTFQLIEDERLEYGPLEGIYQLLSHADEDWAFVVATDMPFVSRGFIEKMCLRIKEAQDRQIKAIIPVEGDRLHPLCGLYHKDVASAIEKLFEEDVHKVTKLFDLISAEYVQISELGEEERILSNINTPGEYETIL